MKTMFLFMAIALSFSKGNCQSTCGNLDFENGNFDNWKTYAGTVYTIDTLSVESFIPDRFEIMSDGFDPFTGGAVSVVPPGGAFSCRLGNSNFGAQAEKITYSLNVSEENALFIYKYAIVLEDPGHSEEDQPQFEVKIINESGEITDTSCGYYQVSASANIPGFQNYERVVYKDWTTVGIDLTPYLGQIITICFITKDCAPGAHFGYAYIDAEYSRMEIETFACAGNDSIVLTAPTGFDYLWQPGGFTGRVLSVATNEAEENYTCTLTSVTGCQVTLSASAEIIYIDPDFEYSACDTVRFFGECLADSADIISVNWNFGDGQYGSGMSPLHLYHEAGLFDVQLTISTNKGCISSLSKSVNVIVRPVAVIETEPMCAGISGFFQGQSEKVIPGITTYLWDFGDGSTSSEPAPEKKYDVPGNYIVSLTLINGQHCRDYASTGIEIPLCDVQLPNILTPNYDGQNETFFIKNLGTCSAAQLSVFNRWGNLVFISEEYCNNWRPYDLTSGVYYYVFNYTPAYLHNVDCSKTGFVTINK